MNCIDIAIKAANGRLLTSEVDDIIGDVDKIKEALRLAGKTDNLDQRAMNIAMQRAMEKKIEAARMKRQIAQNIKARAQIDLQVKDFMGAGRSPIQALRALHEGSQRDMKGARKSAYAQGQAYEAKWLGSLFSTVQKEKPHILKMLSSKSFDNDVTRELWELREGGSPGSTKNADAKYLARELAAHMEMSRTELNRLGAAVGKLDGYAGPQVHDDLAMIKAGKEKWVADILPRLDVDRSFPDAASDAEVKGILSGVYDTIVTGVRNDETSPLLQGKRVGPSNLAKGMGAHRVLHFNGPDAAMEYRDLYGRGSTIQGILGQIKHHAKFAGVMDKFGPNPKAMMLSVASRIQQDLRAKLETTTDPKALEKLRKQIKSLNANEGEISYLKATIDDMTGLMSRPESTSVAAIGNNIRSWQAVSKLGGAVLAAMPSDTLTMAGAAMLRGQGYWNGVAKTLGEFANRSNGKEISYLLGEGYDGIIGHVSSAAVAADGMPGRLSKGAELFFKYSGLTGWTDTARAVSARVIAAHLGMNASKGFDKLDGSLRHVLELNGITPEKWEAIRQSGFTKAGTGNHYITPDSVRTVPDELIEPIVAGKIAEAQSTLKPDKFEAQRTKIIEAARHDLELDLHRYYADETNYAVIETDAASRRTANGGFILGNSYRPGTVAGEAIRFVAQFKGFPIAFTQRVFGRAAFNPTLGTGSRALNLGTIMAGLTVAGYMAMTLKDMARGLWPPRDPTDPKVIGAAAMQGGALGIYGDFLFGSKSRFDQGAVATLSGPAVGNFEDLYALYRSARDGDPNAGKALDVALNNTPFINLFYTRPALDFLFLNALRDTARPGYLRRQEANLKGDRGQEYMLPRTLGQALR
jgi:hypothetical protein